MADADTRVRIWNSFFKLAWNEAKHCFELDHNCQSDSEFEPILGGTLLPEQHHCLAAITALRARHRGSGKSPDRRAH